MKSAEVAVFRDFLYKHSGFVLGEGKEYLLNTRLQPVIRRHGITGHTALAAILSKPGVPPALMQDVVDAMTINETSFFRDTKPFDLFKDTILPHLLQARATQKRIRIWCAACSSGQEPYSLAMILKENEAKFAGWSIDIIGTDISRHILQQAQKAVYSQFEVQRGMPISMLMRFFDKAESNHWQLKSDITKMVTFQPINLLEDFKRLGTFDVIFCRNVLIYFDEKTKSDILNRLAAQIQPDGFLLLGGAETVLGLTNRFATIPDKRGLYKPVANSGNVPASLTKSTSSL